MRRSTALLVVVSTALGSRAFAHPNTEAASDDIAPPPPTYKANSVGVDEHLNAKIPLDARFRTQDGKQLDVQGRVIWVNQPHGADSINPGMGVQFVDLTPGERERIMSLVRTFAYLSDDEEKIRGNS